MQHFPGRPSRAAVLLFHKIPRDFGDVICAQAKLTQHFPCRAGMAEFVVHADAAHHRRAFFAEHARDSLAQTADNAVLFAGDDLSAFLRRLDNDFFIQRLNGADVDDARVNPLYPPAPWPR